MPFVGGDFLISICARTILRRFHSSNHAGCSELLEYSNKHNLYIRGKRVQVKWADRQFHLPAHVASKIANHGASRTMLIKNPVPRPQGNGEFRNGYVASTARLTARKIRDDLEHIHNLVVVDVKFLRGGDVLVELNSVHNALFARTCMLSRVPYRGLRIEWALDQCAGPLPKPMQGTRVVSGSQQPKPSAKDSGQSNMFALLEMDPSEPETDNEDCFGDDHGMVDDEDADGVMLGMDGMSLESRMSPNAMDGGSLAVR